MIVTIGGPPGSGKTTVAEKLAEECGLFLISTGKLFRDMACKKRMSVEEFGRYAMENEKIDLKLDRMVMAEVLSSYEKRDLCIEGRLAAHMVDRNTLKAFKVWIDAPLDVRSRRVSRRDNISYDKARTEILEREKCERTRYRSIYGIDLDNLKLYNLVIDSKDLKPGSIVRIIRQEAGL